MFPSRSRIGNHMTAPFLIHLIQQNIHDALIDIKSSGSRTARFLDYTSIIYEWEWHITALFTLSGGQIEATVHGRTAGYGMSLQK